MTEASRVCAKCGGAMTVGVVVDGLQGGQQMPYWVEGIPDENLFGSLKLRAQRAAPVVSFRCEACGYLEFFAQPA
jgi:hypothetical protein